SAQPAAGLPVRLSIPAIAVAAAVEPVGQTPEGAMDVPRGYDSTGWYQYGPRPGAPGSAVITGHVDSPTAPAVFWDLRALTPGEAIVVESADGSRHRFVVTAVASQGAGDENRRGGAPLRAAGGHDSWVALRSTGITAPPARTVRPGSPTRWRR
ncbi:MAG: class F sortase, partial [Chloroflexota bacterium]|nr:class F sortase [Chloroflexota bacterium]